MIAISKTCRTNDYYLVHYLYKNFKKSSHLDEYFRHLINSFISLHCNMLQNISVSMDRNILANQDCIDEKIR